MGHQTEMTFDVANLTPVEAVWLLAALLALLFAAINLHHSRRDKRASLAVYNGMRASRIVVADGYMFRAHVRIAIFSWWTLLGVAYGFFEMPDAPKLAGTLGLVATAYAWSIIGIQEEAERRTLDGLIARATAERLAQLVGGDVTTHLERTADNTARIAQATDELLHEKHENEGDPR